MPSSPQAKADFGWETKRGLKDPDPEVWNEGRPTAQKLVLIERDTEDYRSFLADGRLLLCCYVLLQEKPASLAGDVRKCMELAEQQPVRLRRSRDACVFDVKTLHS